MEILCDPHASRCAFRQRFRDHMTAYRNAAAEGRGALLEGTLSCLLARVEVDVTHGRLTRAEASRLAKFGRTLSQHLPLPHLVIHLATTPAASCERAAAPELAIEDVAKIGKRTAETVAALQDRGCECVRRKWDAFGCTRAMRDVVLCATPPPRRERGHVPMPPSDAAVERTLADAWAACQTRRTSRISGPGPSGSPTRGVQPALGVDDDALSAPPASPASCGTSRTRECEVSPVSICAGFGKPPSADAMDGVFHNLFSASA